MKRFLALLLLTGSAQAADPKLDALLACARANVPQTIQVKDVELHSKDRAGGERKIKARLYATREGEFARVMVSIQSPPDLARAAYLVREGAKSDEMYVYVPSLNKTRRILGGSGDSSLWGTDLSYNDIKQIENAFNGGNAKLEAPQPIEGRATNVVAFTPRPGEVSRFSQMRAWLDDKACVPLKLEFTEGTVVRKRFTVLAKDLKQSGTYWYAQEAVMEDLKDRTSTRLKVAQVTQDMKLPARLFSSSSFHLGN